MILEGLEKRNADELIELIYRLKAENDRYKYCPTYNILTRAGLESVWTKFRTSVHKAAIAYIDIDDLKAKNTLLGSGRVDVLLAKVFSAVRSGDKLDSTYIGRYYSGDEFAILSPAAQIMIPCRRLLTALQSFEDPQERMSATIAIVPYLGEFSIKDAVADAAQIVAIAKKLGNKARIINFLPEENAQESNKSSRQTEV